MTIQVGIVGATGYTALEVARLLLSHPEATLVAATSRADAGKPLSAVHPSLSGRCDVVIETLDADEIAKKCDVVMCCLPHGASAETCKQLVEAGTRVVDFSADFRLSNRELYEKWYGVTHPWPERIGKTPYGLPEFYADEIRSSDLVANPGCYPTSVILPLQPLLHSDMIEATDIIVDSKSGVSGAGRSPKLGTLYCEVNDSIAAYGVGSHRHQPEMVDILHRAAGTLPSILFTPHLTPMDRGILSTIYVKPKTDAGGGKVHAKQLIETWQKRYRDCPFLVPTDALPATKHVAGTNYVHMTARDAADRIVIVCAIDNLTKGASGAAIQNMNVMFGVNEGLGL
ncbi:N-acetyl-gamma-glutamyl-phosphate reductase [Novipirellula artificiosorum]|uniref:N-acetyl-gamma-glutamyl-phosphate reductase n=1 Tax=Novipirellula artificiosorum TaxID=2528016 RepID=A0A5C6DIG1_9BACT|nr:N-acetyl-gamma-glutamyl-phosphate reductase [Novipirellula artificiosorum]TWU37153.1 N-acetyl-gamma-glutamyl-phosphate reductase [Novipirellula artificiosorum]